METLFNVNQAAFILKLHPLTIRRYIKEGKLKALKVGGNIRIKESQLQEFNTELVPGQGKEQRLLRYKTRTAKIFSMDDPFWRLKGRGAGIKIA